MKKEKLITSHYQRTFTKAILFITTLAFLSSCATQKVNKKVFKRLRPLTEDTEVQVFSDKSPTFSIDKICEAKVIASGYYTKTSMSSYSKEAKNIARECGANVAVIKSLTGFSFGSSADVTVKVEVGLRSSEDSKFNGKKKIIKKFLSAVSLGNVRNTSLILKKLKVNKNRSKRSYLDEAIIGQVMRMSAEKGSSCPRKTLSYLYKNYGATLDHFANYKTSEKYATNQFVKTDQILKCDTMVIAKSFAKIKNKEKAIIAINNDMTDSLNGGWATKVSKKNFKKLYPKMMKAIDTTCSKDQLSSLCSAKANLKKIYKASK